MGSEGTCEMDVPFPDHDGFISWVENEYTDERWSHVQADRNPKTGGRIRIRSGEYPAYSRFLKDIRPELHERGFVISSAEKDTVTFNSDYERVHSITAIPLIWVVAYINGYVCRRGACRHITTDGYCEDCNPFYDDAGDPHAPKMINP